MIATVENKLDAIRDALPSEGLFAFKDWLISPDAFPISEKFASELEQLGHRLFVFQRACNQLYQLSVRGKQPAWIAEYLDAGKPAELVELSRQKVFRDELPRVIRPDLILTENSYIIAEIDSVPGGIGLTGWLNRTYSALGQDVIGGEEGMLDGFQKVLPNGGDILVSEESATYRPEMEWLAAQLNLHRTSNLEHPTSKWRVVPAENYEPQPGRDVYRFFELFDLPNIPKIEVLLRSAAEGKVRLTPPVKPFLEEKMWFALFWLKPLRQFWRRELGDKYFLKLRQVIPYTWLLDPMPLPQHAVIPRLELHDWRDPADDFTAIPQRQLVRAFLLRRRKRRSANDERTDPFVSVLFCGRRSGKIARRSNDNCAGGQKVNPRNARRHSGADQHEYR